MSESKHSQSKADKDPTLDGELNLRLLVGSTVGLLLIIAIAIVAMWSLGFGIKDRLVASDPPPPVLPEARIEHRPPGPNLQVDPRQQLLDLRADEESILTTYGWIDETHGMTRVPIDRAIDLLVEQGLPTPPPATIPSEEASTGN
jgi:hypothetical protein